MEHVARFRKCVFAVTAGLLIPAVAVAADLPPGGAPRNFSVVATGADQPPNPSGKWPMTSNAAGAESA